MRLAATGPPPTTRTLRPSSFRKTGSRALTPHLRWLRRAPRVDRRLAQQPARVERGEDPAEAHATLSRSVWAVTSGATGGS